MKKYASNLLKENYVCPTCNLKLDFDTATGEVTKYVGALAAFGGFALVMISLFTGGSGGGGNSSGA